MVGHRPIGVGGCVLCRMDMSPQPAGRDGDVSRGCCCSRQLQQDKKREHWALPSITCQIHREAKAPKVRFSTGATRTLPAPLGTQQRAHGSSSWLSGAAWGHCCWLAAGFSTKGYLC